MTAKAIGGSDRCHTCAAHCVVIEDLEKERDSLAAKVNEAQDAAVTLSLKLGTADARIATLESALRRSRPYVDHAECADAADLEARGCALNEIDSALGLATQPPTTNSGSVGGLCEQDEGGKHG